MVTNKEGKPEEWKLTRTSFVALVAKMLDDGSIGIGTTGSNMDIDRLPIDTVVIHYTSTEPHVSLSYIESLILIRLYTKEYSNKENEYYGKPLWSGHLYNGRQTFHAYHYLIAQNRTVFHTLYDKYIGWQAGEWNTNCRSIAIGFIDDLKRKSPIEEAITSAKNIIKKYNVIKVIGHNEIYKTTECPGNQFYNGENWKNKLIF